MKPAGKGGSGLRSPTCTAFEEMPLPAAALMRSELQEQLCAGKNHVSSWADYVQLLSLCFCTMTAKQGHP